MPESPTLVLVAPQDIVNIASAVRICKNFGIDDLRLVTPAVFDPWRIEGIAHNTADLVERIRIFDSLDDAVADCGWVAGLTARGRAAKRSVLRPRPAARDVIERLAEAPVAIVAGREDKGLTNAELDRCQVLITIPTAEYSSLNLAQAVALMSYELWLARGGEEQPVKPPRHVTDPALAAQLEMLFTDWERALWAIEFFKTRQPESVLRSFREIIFRAKLDGREAALVRAMGIEVRRFLDRKGIPAGDGPPAD
jgi:tRNA/rRNA methyltransferase/tRNA (cytidine32/uridine32-2'-O)-methyltransferase